MEAVRAVLEIHTDKDRCFSAFFRILQKYGEQTSDEKKREVLRGVSDNSKFSWACQHDLNWLQAVESHQHGREETEAIIQRLSRSLGQVNLLHIINTAVREAAALALW